MAPAAVSDGAAPLHGDPPPDDHLFKPPMIANGKGRPRPVTAEIRTALDAVLDSEIDFTVYAPGTHQLVETTTDEGGRTVSHDAQPLLSPAPVEHGRLDRNQTGTDADLLEEIDTASDGLPRKAENSSQPSFTLHGTSSQSSFRVLGGARNPSNVQATTLGATEAGFRPNGTGLPNTIYSSVQESTSSLATFVSDTTSHASFATANTTATARQGSFSNSSETLSNFAQSNGPLGSALSGSTIMGDQSDYAMEELVPDHPASVDGTAMASSTQLDSSGAKVKPQLPRLSIVDTLSAPASRSQASPGMAHWQQVKNHILMVPTQISERPSQQQPNANAKETRGKLAFVTKAAGKAAGNVAGRLGLRSAVESVMGLNHTPAESMSWDTLGIALNDQEKEEAARQRRRFARDIRVRLDACSYEESRRRLQRMAVKNNPSLPTPQPHSQSKAYSTVHSRTGAASTHKTDVDNQVSAFAPFLIELHRHLPDARAKRVWSRSCPHHSAILAELGVSFIPDASSTDGERAQALEVFGVVVRNWSTDTADEELSRWLWLCRALVIDDRKLRDRGLPLLAQLLRADPQLPRASYAPSTAFDFESITIALLALLRALEISPIRVEEHILMVSQLLSELAMGGVMQVSVESLIDLIKDVELQEHPAGIEYEMLWLAVGRAINTELELGDWLLRDNGAVLERFLPPPKSETSLLATQCLRSLAAIEFFNSFSVVIKGYEGEDLVSAVASWADLLYDQCQSVAYEKDTVTSCYMSLLMDIEMKGQQRQTAGDPFGQAAQTYGDNHARLAHLLEHSSKSVIDKAVSRVVYSSPPNATQSTLRKFLDSDLVTAGRAAVPHFLRRLKPSDAMDPVFVTFSNWLSANHPQLFYKPLFSCAAATQQSSLLGPLKIVINLQRIVGPDRFWTHADPQMVMIVLVGSLDVQPAKGKGKAQTEDLPVVTVKLGRYAILIELIQALQSRRLPSSSAMRDFLTVLEIKFAALLEMEEAGGPHPPVYLALICQLIERLRLSSSWIKRTVASRLLIKWYTGGKDGRSALLGSAVENSQVRTLHSMYTSELADFAAPRVDILNKDVYKAMASALITIQASLGKDDWLTLLPVLWARYGTAGQPTEQLTFLLMKCAEQLPEAFRSIVTRDLENQDSRKHLEALLKLATLYGYRYQVFTQPTVTDSKRGPLFRFNARILDFVMAEMGSSVWVTPREAQDAQLQRYGRSLPLELRQRLWDLGWNEDSQLTIHDYERVPVTLLPAESYAESTRLERSGSQNSQEAPKRSKSLRAIKSRGGTVHRAVLPPIIGRLVNDQARMFINFDDSLVVISSEELVRMFEREDPGHFARAFTENLQTEFEKALRRVNSVIQAPTPSYAYTALNAIAGYLKTNVKDDPNFAHWPVLLGTLARIVPHVSELSLRDVRKTKSEAALLPASIYEDDTGFKVHQPWRNAYLDVQTGQLILLEAILRSNPRDVYLVKKMLFNLQVQASFRHIPFARAWLQLVVQMFRCLNSNYNDRAELRHFVRNITQVVALHGTSDIIMVGQAMVALSLCSARFRRAFGSIGFVDLMRQLYVIYVYGTPGIKDCVEYACRSFYRIHQDTFIYQTFLAICESPFDPKAAYDLLSSLSMPNGPSAGVASGIRGLNDQYEIHALVQMISAGPEITLAEIRTSEGERRAQKAANLNLEPILFPQANIIRFLVTVIAFNAASPRAIKFLRLFTGLVPYMMTDDEGQALLREGIDALGRFINTRCATADESILLRFEPGEDAGELDWTQAIQEYIALVDAYAREGGVLPGTATRRLLQIINSLLTTNPQGTEAVSSILGSLARASLKSKDPYLFMKHIAPTYEQHIGSVDFSTMLDALTAHIRANNYQLGVEMTALVVFEYVEPALRMLALASEASMGFIVPLRHSAIELLSAAVFLRGCDALNVLERVSMSPGLLAGVILPFALALEAPPDADKTELYQSIWLRLLRLVINPVMGRRKARVRSQPQLHVAALNVLALQVIKVIVIRAPDAISAIPGLWTHIAQSVTEVIADGNGAFYGRIGGRPRVLDWMMWSTFELLCLFRTPLNIALRLRIQTVLSGMHRNDRPGSAGSQGSDGTHSPHASPRMSPLRLHTPSRSLSGLARRPSARIPSITVSGSAHSRTASNTSSPGPGSAGLLRPSPRLSRIASISGPSQLSPLTPFSPLSPGLQAPGSPKSPGEPSSPTRPSFAAISEKRAAAAGPGRPLFDAFASAPPPGTGLPNSPGYSPTATLGPASATESRISRRFTQKRFTSDQPPKGSDKGAIVHLLGPASQVASASGTGWALSRPSQGGSAALLMPLSSPELISSTSSAVKTCGAVYGYEDSEDAGLKTWSLADALQRISEQTRLLVENEFGRVFRPPAAAQGLERIASRLGEDREKEKEIESDDEKQEGFDRETSEDGGMGAQRLGRHTPNTSVALSIGKGGGEEVHNVPSLLAVNAPYGRQASPSRSDKSGHSDQTQFTIPGSPTPGPVRDDSPLPSPVGLSTNMPDSYFISRHY